jgi:hypothetical protein
MRNRLLFFLLALLLCTTTGCSRGQRVGLFSGQKEMETASQWNVLANDVANRINMELMRQNYLNASVFVRHSCGKPDGCGPNDTYPFDQGFNELLTTQLVNFGVHTVLSPESATLVVDYKVQVVYHPSDWQTWNWPKPGMLIALAAGITVIHDAPWEIIPIAGAIDMFRANYQDSGCYEVIITTSIVDKNRYVMRTSDIYLINSADYWQYRQPSPAVEIQLTGANAAPRNVKRK